MKKPSGAGGRDISGNGFAKRERVRKRAEIERVFRKGIRYSCTGMRIHVVENSLGYSRALIAPVRSYANAVARNRAKRLARESWRLGKGSIASGYDIAIVLFPGSDELGRRRSQLDRLVAQAGVRAR